jgi:hypothetical protein
MTLEEYAPKFMDFFTLKREGRILEAKFHTNGGSLIWSAQVHRAIWQLCTYAGQDMDNEIIIFGGTGENWISGQDETGIDEIKDYLLDNYKDTNFYTAKLWRRETRGQ